MAVGLDTPASALGAAATRCATHGMRVDHDIPADGDALMHALIAAGGHDPEFLTDEQLAGRAAADHRRPTRSTGMRTLPAALPARSRLVGPATGRPYRRRRRPRDRRARARRRASSLIQPPRGYGEDPVGIYHDPELAADPSLPRRLPLARPRAGAPTRSSTSASTARSSGCRGRCSRSAPPARRTPRSATLPLIYPFVVNDPGEGAQAKRRAHAVIVDHLVPPMMRAESYDELADLEALLDDYARLEVLDPSKLPALARADLGGDRAGQPAGGPGDRASGRPTRASSSSTSTATSARSRTSRSRTACTSSARSPRGRSCAAWSRSSPATGRAVAARDRRGVRAG